MLPLGAALSIPALFAAGIAASPHCLLMCSAVQLGQLRGHPRGGLRPMLALHAGRIAGYAALGAVAGGFGGVVLARLPDQRIGAALQLLVAAALALVALGNLRVRHAPAVCCVAPQQGEPGTARMLLRGLAWAAMPCGLLYALLTLAVFAGSAWQGAALLAAFGAGTLPLLAAGGKLLATLARPDTVRRLRVTAALLLVTAASAQLLVYAYGAALPGWCLPG